MSKLGILQGCCQVFITRLNKSERCRTDLMNGSCNLDEADASFNCDKSRGIA